MAIDASLLTDYTWAQIKIAAKQAMMTTAIGGRDLTIGGKRITRVTLDEAASLYRMAAEMESAENASEHGGIALVNFESDSD
jgi:hypothetical protein